MTTLECKSKIWLCVVSKSSFEVIKNNQIYAVPDSKRALMHFKRFTKGDVLLFYLVTPVQKIMGSSKILSSIYVNRNNSPWPKIGPQYPNRVRISPITPLYVPRNKFVGKLPSVPNISLGISIIEVDSIDYDKILSLSENGSFEKRS